MRFYSIALGLACGATTLGCSSEETRQLEPSAFAMTATTPASFDDGEDQLLQVSGDVILPIRIPTDSERGSLAGAVKPFDRKPWVTTSNFRVQLSWTMANLDDVDHVVRVLVDPWNEFGRYVPGTTGGDEPQPNLSGIDDAYDLPALGKGRPSRITHVYSYDDMDELAVDFATVINIIQNGPMSEGDAADEEDPRVGLVNHAFAIGNHSGQDPLTDPYIPDVIPALTGFQVSIRMPAPEDSENDDGTPNLNRKTNIAFEYVVEVIDRDGNRMLDEDGHEPALSAPATVFTVGGG